MHSRMCGQSWTGGPQALLLQMERLKYSLEARMHPRMIFCQIWTGGPQALSLRMEETLFFFFFFSLQAAAEATGAINRTRVRRPLETAVSFPQ